MTHDLSHLWTAYWLAIGFSLAALLGACPGIYDIFDHLRHAEDSPGVARWAYLLLGVSVVQLAYAVYVGQLPDWSSVWMGTLLALLLSALYATLLGILLLSSEVGGVLAALQLEAGHHRQGVSWCFVLLGVNCLLTYLGGRSGANWYRAHTTLTAALQRRSS